MAIKKVNLEVGKTYTYRQQDNCFELLALYGVYAWVVWGKGTDEEEVETLFLDTSTLKEISQKK